MHDAGLSTRRTVCRLAGCISLGHWTISDGVVAPTLEAIGRAESNTRGSSADENGATIESNHGRFDAYRGVVGGITGEDLVIRIDAEDAPVDRLVDRPSTAVEIVEDDDVIVLFDDGFPRTVIPSPISTGGELFSTPDEKRPWRRLRSSVAAPLD